MNISEDQESIYIKINFLAKDLEKLISEIIDEKEKLPRSILQAYKSFDFNWLKFDKISHPKDSGQYELILDVAEKISLSSLSLIQNIREENYRNELSQKIDKIEALGRELGRITRSSEILIKNDIDILSREHPLNLRMETDFLNKQIKELRQLISDSENRIQNLNAKLTIHENSIEKSLINAQDMVSSKSLDFDKSINLYLEKVRINSQERLKKLDTKESEINKTIGSIASKVISGGYAENAKSEEKYANNFRLAALFLMLIVGSILTVTLHEINTSQIDGVKIAARLAISLFLTFPITYLARESGKHRTQQLKHMQTSLDLSAITPYLESLPPETKEKIKAEMASRLFFSEDKTPNTESLPLNAQEIIIKLLDKIDFSSKK